MDKAGCALILTRLARKSSLPAAVLYTRVMGAWGVRPDRKRATIKVSAKELRLLRALKLPPNVLNLDEAKKGWVAEYRHPTKPQIAVTVHTKKKPKRKRVFKFRGGTYRLTAVSITNITKEAARVATKTKKKSKAKADEIDELEELEGLEELDDEDLEDEEPDDDEDEDEDEDDEEEEAPKRKAKSKKKAPAKKGKKKKAPPVDEDEDDEEDDEDEEDEDEEEEKPKRKAKGKAAKSKSGKSKKSKGKKAAPGEKIPDGRFSPQGIADLSDGEVDARQVRVFLRNNEDTFPKGDGFRYAFTKKQAERIIKKMTA